MKQFGLIGKSLKHSFSARFFNEKFAKENNQANYELFELATVSEFESLIKSNDFSGLNVTIPYKESIIPFLDEISEEAKIIGAVNCIAFKNGKTIGYNTDAFGFHQSVKPFLTNLHEKALIFGNGGASKAVSYIFNKIGIDCIYIVRNPKNDYEFSFSEVNQYMLNACKLLVNCTPVGTFPDVNECFDIPFEFLTDEHLCIDLIYNPEKTLFLQKAEENGASILNGNSMLHEQALKSWEIWNK